MLHSMGVIVGLVVVNHNFLLYSLTLLRQTCNAWAKQMENVSN